MPIAEDIVKLYERYLTHSLTTSSPKREIGTASSGIKKTSLATEFGYNDLSPRLWSAFRAFLNRKSGVSEELMGSRISRLHALERGRLVDVGCGNGKFLARMRALGWDVFGVEPDPQAAQIGREAYGLTIYSGTLEDSSFSLESFDAVTMAHVIEHLTDPLSTLKAARRILKKGGYLLIHTPNLSSLGHRWFGHHWRGLEPPRHLFLFSPTALLKIVRMAGFDIYDLQTIFADSMWNESSALKHRVSLQNLPEGYAKRSGHLYMALQRYITGWPLYRPWGEQLTVVAIKR